MCNHHNDGIYGVVLVVYSSNHTILMLEELLDKDRFYKKAGMLALPSETREKCDECICATVRRLVHEEIGVTLIGMRMHPEPIGDLLHGIPVFVFRVEVQEEFIAKPNDTDVVYGGWFTETQILNLSTQTDALRIETLPSLELSRRIAADQRAPSFT